MKLNRLNKNAVRSISKSDKRITTLPEDELKTVTGGNLECTCSYKYGSTDLSGDALT